MGKLFRSFAVLSLVALCAGIAAEGFAQGYTGGGALAPSPAPSPGNQQPRGYRGLIPGEVDPLPPQEQPQAQTPRQPRTPAGRQPDPQMTYIPPDAQPDAPKMTYAPGMTPSRMMTADELKRIAAAAGVQLQLDLVPAELVKNIHIPSRVYSVLSSPQHRIDGMLPTEFAVKRQIDITMEKIRLAPADARGKVIAEAIQTLSNARHGMRLGSDVPDVIFESMGAPAVYVQESREASGKALRRLTEAITQLRNMQR